MNLKLDCHVPYRYQKRQHDNKEILMKDLRIHTHLFSLFLVTAARSHHRFHLACDLFVEPKKTKLNQYYN